MVNVPSFMVRTDSEKHIEFSLTSPYGVGRPGRVKRKTAKSGGKKKGGDDEDGGASKFRISMFLCWSDLIILAHLFLCSFL